MDVVSRDSPVILEYVQSLILIKKKKKTHSNAHLLWGWQKDIEKKKPKKGEKGIIYSDKHQLIYHCFVPCCLEKKDSRTP